MQFRVRVNKVCYLAYFWKYLKYRYSHLISVEHATKSSENSSLWGTPRLTIIEDSADFIMIVHLLFAKYFRHKKKYQLLLA